MIPSTNFPPIEFPDKPVPMEEAIAAERESIAAKLAYAEAITEEMDADVCADIGESGAEDRWGDAVIEIKVARARLLSAEARVQEINLHNNLFQAGQMAAQMQRQAGLIQVPGLVKQ